jgi:hypothetical protein
LDVQSRHAGIKARNNGNEKRGEGFISPRSRERILLIDADLKGLEKENPTQAPMVSVAIRIGKCNVSRLHKTLKPV